MILDLRTTGCDKYIELVREYNSFDKRKAHVITFGCQQNEADSEKIRALALSMGYLLTENLENADLIVINTCAIRQHAESKALSILGRFKAMKRKNPNLIIGVAGCMVAQPHVSDMLKTDFHYVPFTVEPNLLHKIPELIWDYVSKRARGFIHSTDEGNIVEGIEPVRSLRHRAWVSIMYGCNNFCSYCIVPYVRGRERSRNSEDIIIECKALVASGCKEITLLGQNVNSYRSDVDFAGLLERIAGIEGDFLIRFMTSHPKDCSDELIEVMAKHTPKIAPYFHLPLQSGSNAILRVMNRRYTKERFIELALKLRESIPGIALSTDIIVGFPGETEEDFCDTMDVLRRVEFDLVYSFIYSARVGTPAAKMDNQVPRTVCDDRMARLLKLQDEIGAGRNHTYLGKTLRVLVDSVENRDNMLIANARTDNNKLVHFPTETCRTGHFEMVKIIRTGAFDLFGERIEVKNND